MTSQSQRAHARQQSLKILTLALPPLPKSLQPCLPFMEGDLLKKCISLHFWVMSASRSVNLNACQLQFYCHSTQLSCPQAPGESEQGRQLLSIYTVLCVNIYIYVPYVCVCVCLLISFKTCSVGELPTLAMQAQVTGSPTLSYPTK